MANTVVQAPQMATTRLLSFAVAGIPIAALTTAIGIYLPRHLAAHAGITLTAVGSAFALVRLLDIWVDLMLGLGMDRTETALGRYRVWMLGSVPIIMIPVYILFINPTHLTMFSLIGWLLLLYLGMSMLLLAHSAWASSLSSTYNGRARVFGAIAALGIVGSVGVFLTPVIGSRIGSDEVTAIATIGGLILLVTPITVAISSLSTSERIRPSIQTRFNLKDYWKLVSRPTMRRIIFADLFLALGPGWLSATVLFYLIEGRGYTLAQANIMLLISISAGFIGAPVMSRVAIRWSKHRALMLSGVGYGVALLAFPISPKGDLVSGIAILFALGFFTVAFSSLLRAMTADVGDEVRLETGQERAGLLFAITTLTAKIAGAFSIFFTFAVLDKIGFVAKAGAVNDATSLRGLEIASVAGPAVCVILGAVFCVGYPLTAKRHAEIRKALDEHDALLPGAA